MEAILEKAGLDKNVAKYADLYRVHKSFSKVATLLAIHRPVIRRGISATAASLVKKEDRLQSGLGAYLIGLIQDKDPTGTGKSKASKRRPFQLNRTDPKCTGEFRIKVDDPDFKSMFIAKSSIYQQSD